MERDWWPWPEGSECPVCGKHAIVITDGPVSDEVEGRTYHATGILRNRCTGCGEEFFAAGQGDEVRRQQFAHARIDLGRLPGEAIRSLRHGLGLTQDQLEQRLGVSTGLVGRWERGTVLQSAMADRYLRDLMAHPELVDSHGVIAREGRGPYKKRAT